MKADQFIASGTRIVADDVRFPNEALVIRELGGIVVEVRTAAPPKDTWTSEPADLHASEKQDFAPDVIVTNTFNNESLIAELKREWSKL